MAVRPVYYCRTCDRIVDTVDCKCTYCGGAVATMHPHTAKGVLLNVNLNRAQEWTNAGRAIPAVPTN